LTPCFEEVFKSSICYLSAVAFGESNINVIIYQVCLR